MTQNGSQNDPKMAPKSLQVGPKIGSQTICLHVNASSPSVRAQKPLRKPIWDPFGLDLGSIFNGFWSNCGRMKRIWPDSGLISVTDVKQHPNIGTDPRPRPRLSDRRGGIREA